MIHLCLQYWQAMEIRRRRLSGEDPSGKAEVPKASIEAGETLSSV